MRGVSRALEIGGRVLAGSAGGESAISDMPRCVGTWLRAGMWIGRIRHCINLLYRPCLGRNTPRHPRYSDMANCAQIPNTRAVDRPIRLFCNRRIYSHPMITILRARSYNFRVRPRPGAPKPAAVYGVRPRLAIRVAAPLSPAIQGAISS